MTNIGTCRLCDLQGNLEEGHIIPAQIYRHLKKTSATGFIRHNDAINRRAQDGKKLNMLCGDCEDRFNQWETLFANHIYHPWNKKTSNTLEYGPWLLKFATSVSWRVMIHLMDTVEFRQDLITSDTALINDAVGTWRRFLRDEIPHPSRFEQHMLLFDEIESASNHYGLPPNINRFFTRNTHINMATANGRPSFIFIKMGKAFLFGLLSLENRHQWKDSKIHIRGGHLGGNREIPQSVINYLIERARVENELHSRISHTQQSVIETTMKKDLNKVIDSETFQMMLADIKLFGVDEVLKWSEQKQGGKMGNGK